MLLLYGEYTLRDISTSSNDGDGVGGTFAGTLAVAGLADKVAGLRTGVLGTYVAPAPAGRATGGSALPPGTPPYGVGCAASSASVGPVAPLAPLAPLCDAGSTPAPAVASPPSLPSA